MTDGLFVLSSLMGFEFEDGAAGGNLEFIQLVQFFLGKEDDRFLYGLEDGLIGFYVADLGVAFSDGPTEEPGEILVLLLNGVLLQAAIRTEVSDESVKAVLVVVIQACGFLEFEEVVLEGFDHLEGLQAPFLEAAFLANEFVHVFSGRLNLRLALFLFCLGFLFLDHFFRGSVIDGGQFRLVLCYGLGQLSPELFHRELVRCAEFQIVEVGFNVGEAGFDDVAVHSVTVCYAFLELLSLGIPH